MMELLWVFYIFSVLHSTSLQVVAKTVNNNQVEFTPFGYSKDGVNSRIVKNRDKEKAGVSNNSYDERFQEFSTGHSSSIDISPSLVFQQSEYIGTISENEPVGTTVNVIGHLSVSCEETPYYFLQSGKEYFNLETVFYGLEHNNILTSHHSFDREEKDVYAVEVLAVCSDELTAETTIKVHILDKNDNFPVLVDPVKTIHTTADQSWGKIATFTAFDRDQNDQITYTITGSEEFFIKDDTGDLYAENDYLIPGGYSLTVLATDKVGHTSVPHEVHIHVESDVLKFKSFHRAKSHHLYKRATTTIARNYDIVENSTGTSQLFSVASVQPRPPAERYALVSASVDIFMPPNNDGSVYLKQGLKLDYEDENQREILVIFNRTNLNTPEGRLLNVPFPKLVNS